MENDDKDNWTPIGLAGWRCLVEANRKRKEYREEREALRFSVPGLPRLRTGCDTASRIGIEKPTPKREQLLDHGARDRNGNARGREAYMVKGKRRL